MKKEQIFLKLEILVIILILFFTLAPRLYKINNPIADHHSWRQADTAAVARNFIKDEFNILKPRIDNLTPISSMAVPNPNRFFMTELPLYSFIVANLYLIFGIHEYIGRLVSVGFSLGTVLMLYFLVRRLIGKREAIVAAFTFALMPFSIYFSRVFMPEPAMLFYTVGAILFTDIWAESNKSRWMVLASVFSALALLTKPFTVFVMPVVFYLILRKFKFSIFKKWQFYFFVLITFLPLILWRSYISHFPASIPASEWLFDINGLRFKGAFFHWIFVERFDILMLTAGGVALVIAGLLKPVTKRDGFVWHLWFLGLLIYTAVFAGGNVTHDYYQVPFIPIFAVLLARGAGWILDLATNFYQKLFNFSVIVVCFVSMLAFGWFEVRNFYPIQGGVDLAGPEVDKLTRKDALVIAGDTADVTLLYNTNRHGWVTGYGSVYPNTAEKIEELRKAGAGYYVTTKVSDIFNPKNEFGTYMLSTYKILKKTNDYVIFDLSNPPSGKSA